MTKIKISFFFYLLLFSSCSIYSYEKNDDGIAYDEQKKCLVRRPYKSFTTDDKQIKNFSFWKVDTIANRIFTYNDLQYIRKKLPNIYKNSHFRITKFDYSKQYPLFLFTRSKSVSKSKEYMHGELLFIEIPVIKINETIYVNIGECDEYLKNDIRKSLLKSFEKKEVDIIMSRFEKGYIEKPYKNTIWGRYYQYFDNTINS